VIAASKSDVVDVVHFEDRIAAVGHVAGLTGIAAVLTPALAAHEDGPAAVGRTGSRVVLTMRLPTPWE
jgi:hypothetical protein